MVYKCDSTRHDLIIEYNTKMTATHQNGEKSANDVGGDELGFMKSYVIRSTCANMDSTSIHPSFSQEMQQ